MKQFQIETQQDIQRFLIALKKGVSQNHLGLLAYERGNADRSGWCEKYAYYGIFTGHRRLMPYGDHNYGTIGFHTSEVDVDFAFALDGSGEVSRNNVGEHTASAFRNLNWTTTARTLIQQIQIFSRREKRMMEMRTRRISPKGISSLDRIRF